MKTVTKMTVVFVCVLGCPSLAQRLPHQAPSSHNVELDLSLHREAVVALEPVIVRITLTNRDEEPLTLEVREDGMPHAVASLVSRGGDSFFRHNQRLSRSGPGARQIILRPGESTSGTFLVLMGGPPTGLPFAEQGRYRIKVEWQPDPAATPSYSNVVELTVLPDDRGNTAFLEELSEITYTFYGYDKESVIRSNGEDYIIGIRLLKKIIRQQKPHLVDPKRSPADQKEARLVEELGELLDRYPNSCYFGYIARFLGLVHLKTLEHDLSLAVTLQPRATVPTEQMSR